MFLALCQEDLISFPFGGFVVSFVERDITFQFLIGATSVTSKVLRRHLSNVRQNHAVSEMGGGQGEIRQQVGEMLGREVRT